MKFRLDMVPPTATAQQQKTAVIGGHVRKYDPKNVKTAKETLLVLLMQKRPAKPLEGALRLGIHWCFPWRKSELKRIIALGVAPHTVRPDLDNLGKALCDCMQTAGFFRDDAQISIRTDSKTWGDRPGIDIELEQL